MDQIKKLVLKEAVSHIKRTVSSSTTRNPFFFLIGAGVSCPQVPLSAAIVEHCKEELGSTIQEPDDIRGDPMESYSWWLEHAYHSPEDRACYFRSLIKDKAVSRASLRLAHLLQSGKLSSIVVTPNFDDFVSRALTTFGVPHVVCDHPATAGRIDPELVTTPQILHIHGSYWFYDGRNLSEEIKDRAHRDPEATGTIGQRLDELLSQRSPLVIGYSGWEEDVFMRALERRLASDLRYNIYWFCYREADLESLPNWLKNHPNAYFVVPFPVGGESSLAASESPIAHAKLTVSPEKELPKVKYRDEPELTAENVLEALFGAFNVDDLPLTKNPLRFLASRLNALLPSEADVSAADSIYGLRGVVRRIEMAAEKCDSYWQSAESKLEELFTALRTSRFTDAIVAANELAVPQLDAGQLRRIVEPLTRVINQLSSDPKNIDWVSRGAGVVRESSRRLLELSVARPDDEALVGTVLSNLAKALASVGESEASIALYDEVIETLRDGAHSDTREMLASTQFRKGVALQEQGKFEAAIETYDELLKIVAGADDPTLQAFAAHGLVNKGAALGAIEQAEKELEAYEILLAQFRDSKVTVLREAVARAIVNRGMVFGQIGRLAEEIDAYDQVVATFGAVQIPSIQRQVLRAMVAKGFVQERQGNWEGALGTFNETLERFGSVDAADLRALIARTLLAKGVALDQLKRYDDALSVYEEIYTRYGAATEPALQQCVAAALVNAGAVISKVKGSEDYGRRQFETVIERHAGTTDAALKYQLALAWNGLACARVYEAKALLKTGEEARAETLLRGAERAASTASELHPDLDHALGTKAYILFLQGRKEDARDLAAKAIESGGQVIRDACLEDANTNPVPQDEDFKRMVESIESPSGPPGGSSTPS